MARSYVLEFILVTGILRKIPKTETPISDLPISLLKYTLVILKWTRLNYSSLWTIYNN